MGKIIFNGNHIEITEALTTPKVIQVPWFKSKKSDLDKLLTAPKTIEWLQFYNHEPTASDLAVVNLFFKDRPQVYYRYWHSHDLQFLPNLQKVWCSGFTKEDFSALSAVKILKGINLGRLENKLDLTPLLAYKNTLTELSFENDVSKKSESLISEFKQLNYVCFISSKFKSFEFLSELDIKYFKYYGSRTRDYQDLAKLKNLTSFWLKTNTTWNDFSFIEKLSKIENIELWYCSAITRFPRCEHLKYLKNVLAEQCNKLEDISELKKNRSCTASANGKLLLKTNQIYNTEKY